MSTRGTAAEVRPAVDASDKEAKRRRGDPSASPIFTVVADARAPSSGRRARPPRSPSRGPPSTPEGAAERQRRTPLPVGTREVLRTFLYPPGTLRLISWQMHRPACRQ